MAFLSGQNGDDLTDIYITDWWLVDQYVGSKVFGWGRNTLGQLGNESPVDTSYMVQSGSNTKWKVVEAGTAHTSAIKQDGTLWAWGSNNYGEIGNGTVGNMYSSPVQVGSLTDWAQVSCGYFTTMALKTDGTFWGWGYAWWLDLPGASISSPIQIGTDTNWKQLHAGPSTLVSLIKDDGTIWTCGYDEAGAGGLGNGATTWQSLPVQVGLLSDWEQVACGYAHMLAVKNDGTLWGWGVSGNGQLGYDGYAPGNDWGKSSPIQIGSLNNWRQPACGFRWSLAIKTDGTMWGWGHNFSGAVGTGAVSNTNVYSPTQIGSLTDWKYVDSSTNHSNAVKVDGTLWGWGMNGYGEMGLAPNPFFTNLSPVQLGLSTNWKQVSSGRYTTLATTF
jgi:alpha-tubulin suppressor-like RCC1 family protein